MMENSFIRILIFIAIFLGCLILGTLATALAALAWGLSVNDILGGMMGGDAGLLRVMALINHIFLFLLPPIVFALILRSRGWADYLGLGKPPVWWHVVLGIALLFIAYPIVQKSYEINNLIPLPDWAGQMENSTEEVLKEILTMNNLGTFILNVVIIGLLPGVAEEMTFRGVLQQESYSWVGRGGGAVWITAILFSLLHFQFEGFFPRIVLGALLGYAFLWTKNLWVPILMHFVNNATPVFGMYFFGDDMDTLDPSSAEPVTWWALMLSVIATFGIGYFLYLKTRQQDEPPSIA
ncbi:MAG TPA: type II CAAX endopeptidase family protein [Saprospiraceae bacterium]|nr:type II CAAX endopeptidase family protein [Saprospiraceae bacterium]